MFQKLRHRIGYWLIRDNMKGSEPVSDMSSYRTTSIDTPGGINGMNFAIFSATGGKVVQFNTYDPARDRSETRLYIVTDKDDLGEELAQIITRESLTR